VTHSIVDDKSYGRCICPLNGEDKKISKKKVIKLSAPLTNFWLHQRHQKEVLHMIL